MHRFLAKWRKKAISLIEPDGAKSASMSDIEIYHQFRMGWVSTMGE